MSDHHPEQVATPPGEAIALSPEDALQRWPNTIAETKRLLASEEDLPDRSEQEAFLRNLEDRLVKLKGLVEEDKRLEKLIESTEGKGKSTVSKSRERNTTYISWVLDPAVERRDKDREALRSRNRRAEEKRAALAVRPPAQSSAMVAPQMYLLPPLPPFMGGGAAGMLLPPQMVLLRPANQPQPVVVHGDQVGQQVIQHQTINNYYPTPPPPPTASPAPVAPVAASTQDLVSKEYLDEALGRWAGKVGGQVGDLAEVIAAGNQQVVSEVQKTATKRDRPPTDYDLEGAQENLFPRAGVPRVVACGNKDFDDDTIESAEPCSFTGFTISGKGHGRNSSSASIASFDGREITALGRGRQEASNLKPAAKEPSSPGNDTDDDTTGSDGPHSFTGATISGKGRGRNSSSASLPSFNGREITALGRQEASNLKAAAKEPSSPGNDTDDDTAGSDGHRSFTDATILEEDHARNASSTRRSVSSTTGFGASGGSSPLVYSPESVDLANSGTGAVKSNTYKSDDGADENNDMIAAATRAFGGPAIVASPSAAAPAPGQDEAYCESATANLVPSTPAPASKINGPITRARAKKMQKAEERPSRAKKTPSGANKRQGVASKQQSETKKQRSR